MPPPAVGVMTVAVRDVPFVSSYHAEAAGSKAVEIRAQVSGILKSRDYDEGSVVEEGTQLFQIEPDRYRAAYNQARGSLKQAQARLMQAQLDWKRFKVLYKTGAASQRDRDNSLASYESAKANVFTAQAACDEAKLNLDYSIVRAPIGGFVGKATQSVGNLVNANSSTDSLLTVINKVDPIYVNFSLPSQSYWQIRTLFEQGRLLKEEAYAQVILPSGKPYATRGKLTYLDATIDPNTSVVSVRAEFDNPKMAILPGQFVRIQAHGLLLKQAIVIPQAAMLQTQAGTVVTVVDKEGKAQVRPLKLNGFSFGEWFLVEEGLADGDKLIIDGLNRAMPGAPVNVDQKLSEAVAARYGLGMDGKALPVKK